MHIGKKFTINELMFLSFFSLVTIGKSIGLNANNKVLQLLTIVAFIFIGIKLINSKYTYREIFIISVLVIIGLISYFVTKREGVLLTIITLSVIKDISYKKVFFTAFIVRSIVFMTIISLSLLNIVNNNKIVHWRDGIGFVNRYSLGFPHPNFLHSSLFILVVIYIYIHYEKLNILNYLLICIVNFIIYNFSVSRTGFYSILFTILITIYMKNTEKINYKLLQMVLPICIFFSFITALIYNKFPIINKIDDLLSGRVHYSNHFLIHYNLNLFGYNLFKDNNNIDNGYTILLINYGVIIFLLYVFGFILITKKFVYLKMNKEILLICLFSIYGITEGFLPNIFLNMSLIFFKELLFYPKYSKYKNYCLKENNSGMELLRQL